MRNLYILGSFLFFSTGLFAQHDLHFSQFFAAPLSLNPAAAGAIEYDLRAYMNYRSQWGSVSSGFTTVSAAIDMPFELPHAQFGNNFVGAGLNISSDKAGVTGFNTTRVMAAGAYAIDLGGTDNNPSFLSVGIEAGFIQIAQNLDNATWSEQWTGTGFNTMLPSNELLTGRQSKGNIDLGAGVMWYNSFDDYTRLVMGASMLHATTPQIGVFSDDQNLFRKYIFTTQLFLMSPGSDIAYWPSLMYVRQGPNQLLALGAEAELQLQERTEHSNFRNNISLNGGAYYRFGDAIYFVGRVNYHDFSLGISYDITVSKLKTANNGNGAIELIMAYRPNFSGPGSKRMKLQKGEGL